MIAPQRAAHLYLAKGDEHDVLRSVAQNSDGGSWDGISGFVFPLVECPPEGRPTSLGFGVAWLGCSGRISEMIEGDRAGRPFVSRIVSPLPLSVCSPDPISQMPD